MSAPEPVRNPFVYPGPVTPDALIGRGADRVTALTRLYSGQSSLITGEPQTGKSSLLATIAADLRACPRPDADLPRVVVTWVEEGSLPQDAGFAQFWEAATAALEGDPALSPIHARARAAVFRPEAMEAVARDLERTDARLVVLAHDFDRMLTRPGLMTAQFFAGFRAITGKPGARIAALATGRVDLRTLVERITAAFGSPPFNGWGEIPLGPWEPEDEGQLLSIVGGNFDASDARWLCAVAGGHPGLLVAAARALWDLRGQREARSRAARALLTAVEGLLNEVWRGWSAGDRAFVLQVLLADLAARRGETPLPTPSASGQAPALRSPPTVGLAALLAELFTAEELLRLSSRLGGEKLRNSLRSGASLEEMASELNDALQRRGMITPALFAVLAEERSFRRDEIRRVAGAAGLVLPPPGTGSAPLPDPNTLRRKGWVQRSPRGHWELRPAALRAWLAGGLTPVAEGYSPMEDWLDYHGLREACHRIVPDLEQRVRSLRSALSLAPEDHLEAL